MTHQITLRVAKIILGLGIIGSLLYFFPVVELVTAFLGIVAVPLLLLASTGMIASSSYELLSLSAPELRARIDKHLEELRSTNVGTA